ncbi:L,D-transpeptidase [Cohnella algarum]|uniref:L,D-transpeptidase n=1 Tax=Cohnella algarum TaxID=2044859 RepID=UPI0019671CA0|nr:L,D-transpeptidase [Cohnella algarum]MBN2984772.1 L,D-transpeptidase [Cohnella algarum]
MRKDDQLEDQIRQFYENVPDVADSLPLKDYLLKHENNQMAWYLLGKQYAARGEEAKANYCFGQAGPIYEAFEARANPLLSVQGEAAPKPARRSRLRRAVSLLGAALVVAAAIALPGERAAAPTEADGTAPQAQAEAPPAAASPSGTPAAPEPAPPAATAPPSGGFAYVAGAATPEADGMQALGQLLTAEAGGTESLLVQAPALGKWTDWVGSGKPLAKVAMYRSDAAAAIDWYDPRWCPCGTAQDPTEPQQAVADWKPLQEGKLMLRSAMLHYKERTGSWPKSPEELAGAYPANAVAGWSEDLGAWFAELREELEKVDGAIPKTVGWPDASGTTAQGIGMPAGSLASMTEHPLRIIVDKKNYRLAVVSGNVLIRNYPVGLGGDKTPEGTFVITEKVRDPNGRSDGAFGSRGMTLSDTLYAIHGTDEPDSIGKDDSLGCVRMGKEDLEELYDLVPLGTQVTIVKEGLPTTLRIPEERFRLTPAQDETNPHKTYNWLG